jgi:hypothetical protein
LKAVTHDVFSLGLCLYLLSREGQFPFLPSLLLVAWLTFSTNKVIDVLGHTTRGGFAVRSFWTHSMFTAPIWGISLASASVYLFDVLLGQPLSTSQALFAIGIGATISYSHLLLDALTEGGIYLGRRRFALAHASYNNPVLNGGFAVLGAAFLLAALL